MGSPRTTPAVLAAFNRHRGLDVPLAELVRETNLTPDQVKSAIQRLIGRDNLPITVVAKSSMWRYEGVNATIPQQRQPEKPVDTVFEVIGRTKSGEPIVRGDITDTLYRVTALEF